MMTESEQLFYKIVDDIPDAIEGKVFGAKCIKSGRKASCILWNDTMLFKLDKADQVKALGITGSKVSTHLYAEDRLMNGWITIPFENSDKWLDFAKRAMRFVNTLEK